MLATIDELFYTFDEAKQRELIEILARVTNEFVPFVAMGEKAEPIKIYAPETKITGFPGVEAPFWYSGLNSYARLIKAASWRPPSRPRPGGRPGRLLHGLAHAPGREGDRTR